MTEIGNFSTNKNSGEFSVGLKKSKIFSPVLGRKPADKNSGEFS